ncbi:hypothetical protein CERSUDRAFT_123736 [Gelatoporia subvermispora B]|uniref:Uncharacterized protein n=1 Tax=Ceriporiopsis subvermispora (strain B) TaxID=914234 RepID=M2RHG8_CERS8|nr:hypothetical protein CERSUDRAFT_123736 [Gelatoporia subvermispora B]
MALEPLGEPNFDAVKGPVRFFAPEGMLQYGTSYYNSAYKVFDHLQDRWYWVRYTRIEVYCEEAEADLAVWVDKMLDNNVLSQDGDGTWTISRDPDFRPPLLWQDKLSDVPGDWKTIRSSELHVTGVIQPRVYVVGQWQRVFKRILFIGHVPRTRAEINAHAAIGTHPRIVPIESIVLADDSDEIVGMTLPFIKGGNFDVRTSFKMKWFIQLMNTVDDFRNRFNLSHGDIAPRNILVGDDDNIRIIDFEAARQPAKDDSDVDGPCVVVAVYETVTKRDWEVDGEVEWHHNPERLRRRGDFVMQQHWESVVELDDDIALVKDLLLRWVVARERDDFTWSGLLADADLPSQLSDFVARHSRSRPS